MMVHKHWRLAGAIAAALGAAVAVHPASAQSGPEAGAALAAKLCMACHVQAGAPPAGLPAALPSFTAIANRPDQTAERIAGVLIRPHQTMPTVPLTRDEVDTLIAYLQTLRDPTLPPLRAPQLDAKPPPRPSPT